MNLTIDYINDHPESTPTIAEWHIGQWGHILDDFTLRSYKEYLASHYQKGGIPSLFVAVNNKKVIGTAALDDYDMDTHQELSPWIASLYVDKEHRQRGVGTALINRVITEARVTGVKKLYLFTPDQERFLARFGWKLLFREKYYGEMESVMVLDISPHTPSR
jgi:N-acetylglutamate synthase-like GNAT family acetyltransferase